MRPCPGCHLKSFLGNPENCLVPEYNLEQLMILIAEKGKTVLIVTHDEKSASVCDEKFVLEEGMLKKSLILSGGVD